MVVKGAGEGGANAPDTPIIGGSCRFFAPDHEAEIASLPPLFVFLTGASTWSDGTPAAEHRMQASAAEIDPC